MEWISVRDKLPQYDVSVLCFCRIYGSYVGTYFYIGYFNGEDYGNWSDGKNIGCLPPTHWMPLPEPPNDKT